MGDWSMSITLSKTSMPCTARWAPGFTRARFRRLARALKMTSFTSVLLPDPLTPVTQMSLLTGRSTSIAFRLCSVAPGTPNQPASCIRRSGTGMQRRPERYAPVIDRSDAITCSAVPAATTRPPCSPAPGPMSTMWSAARIVSSSCSTTITVLPSPRSRSSVARSLALSRWCSPIEGSSRM